MKKKTHLISNSTSSPRTGATPTIPGIRTRGKGETIKKQILLSLIICSLVVLPLLAACAGEGETPETSTTTASPTTTSGNWWDTFGEPEYGGTITFAADSLELEFDPTFPMVIFYNPGYNESLFSHDWTLDRDTWNFQGYFVSEEYWKSGVAESWEWTDPQTAVVSLRKGVYWHDKPPANGREFTAYDVQYHFDRMMGTGNGFTEPSVTGQSFATSFEKVTAIDDYTFTVKFKEPAVYLNSQSLFDPIAQQWELPEAVESGEINDWEKAAGIGPWVLTNYVANTSLELSKNPNYWDYDERHPENTLPYADEIKIVVIPDLSTKLAALRSGQIDYLSDISWQQAESLNRTSPDLQQIQVLAMGPSIILRVDHDPFNDINVRKAMNMAIDRPQIAEYYYGGTTDWHPAGLVAPSYEGWCYPYDEWTQELKDGYGYDPEAATELLAEAGYPDGFSTSIVAKSSDDLELLQIIKDQLNDIDIDMTIETMDPTTADNVFLALKHEQMAMYFSFMIHPPNTAVETYYSTSPRNFAQSKDANYDALVDSFRAASSTEEAMQTVQEIDKYFLEQFWTLNICPTTNYTIFQPYLKGYSGEMIFWERSFYWSRIWIDQDLKETMGH